MSSIPEILELLAQGKDLDTNQASQAFTLLMSGELTPSQSGAVLMGLRAKGETPDEMAACVDAALGQARLTPKIPGKSIDTCGTGGDNSHSFNCSTCVALYLAALGYSVVKHGNRSISSLSGSADIVEALGLPLALEPEAVPGELTQKNFAFLFAPHYHPAFKHIMPVRKELGIRTLFNLMGPLLNPARPTHQILGVARPEIMRLMAEVLKLTGIEKALVVHGHGGFDELTPFGPSQALLVTQAGIQELTLDPAELGIAACDPKDVTVAGKDEAVAAVRQLLTGQGPTAMREMLVLNLGAALSLLDDTDLASGIAKARQAVNDGAARGFVEG